MILPMIVILSVVLTFILQIIFDQHLKINIVVMRFTNNLLNIILNLVRMLLIAFPFIVTISTPFESLTWEIISSVILVVFTLVITCINKSKYHFISGRYRILETIVNTLAVIALFFSLASSIFMYVSFGLNTLEILNFYVVNSCLSYIFVKCRMNWVFE